MKCQYNIFPFDSVYHIKSYNRKMAARLSYILFFHGLIQEGFKLLLDKKNKN